MVSAPAWRSSDSAMTAERVLIALAVLNLVVLGLAAVLNVIEPFLR